MSSFNWHGKPLSRDTPITGSYKNTQNVRRFFLTRLWTGLQVRSPIHAVAEGQS